MNKKNWLIVGLSLAMAASIGVGISACGEKEPDTPEHTHEYTKWQYDADQHWKVCPADDAMDPAGKSAHDFKDGKCECGATEGSGPVTLAELDTREFYVVGGGIGDLATGTWTGPNASFKFTKATEPDANGYTVYTYQMKLYSADEFKFIEQNTISQKTDAEGNTTTEWDAATTFMLADLDVTAVPDAFKGDDNIVVNTGADGVYRFTLLTKKGGSAKENKVKVELVEPVEALDVTEQYEMYLVGTIASKPGTKWPSLMPALSDAPKYCYKLELQEDGRTFSIEVKLATKDEFKVWNYKTLNASAGYYPTGEGGNLTVKEDGWYVVSWKVGEAMPTITPHEHRYTEWGYDADGHWKQCPIDQAIDEETRGEHTFTEGVCECGAPEPAECTHNGGIEYQYTAAPEFVAEGGELDAVCALCKAPLKVQYDKGAEAATSATSATILENSGKTYLRVSNGASLMYYVAVKVTKAGAYSLTLNTVFQGEGEKTIVKRITVSTTLTSATLPSKGCIFKGDEFIIPDSTTLPLASKFVTRFLFNGEQFDLGARPRPCNDICLTFTVEQTDLSDGEFYVMVGYNAPDGTPSSPARGYLVTLDIQDPAASSILAPAEVAMLPEKKD